MPKNVLVAVVAAAAAHLTAATLTLAEGDQTKVIVVGNVDALHTAGAEVLDLDTSGPSMARLAILPGTALIPSGDDVLRGVATR